MNILFLNSVLKITVWLSLLIQIITAFVDIYVLGIYIPKSMKLIKQLVIFDAGFLERFFCFCVLVVGARGYKCYCNPGRYLFHN